MAVGDHHVGHLIERLAAHFDAVHLDDLVAHGQQARGLGEATGEQPRDEHTGHVLHAVRTVFDGHAVANVEAERFALLVAMEFHATVSDRQNFDVDDRRHEPKVRLHLDVSRGRGVGFVRRRMNERGDLIGDGLSLSQRIGGILIGLAWGEECVRVKRSSR